MKKVIITGATGFIGSHLCPVLLESGYDITVLTRNTFRAEKALGRGVRCVKWDGKTAAGWQEYADNALAIINLAGANIAGIWTEKYKRVILQSRLDATAAVVQAIQNAGDPPKVLLQGSATGYYGSRGEEILDENASKGEGFLPEVVAQWEAAAKPAEAAGIRVAYLRSGVVLGRGEGVIEKLSLPFKLFLGGTPGSGKQWFSWIHIEDEVNSIKFLLENTETRGIYNLVSPEPVKMADFCRELGRAMNRPSWLPVPEFALKLLMGQMAEETALSSQRILPRRLKEAGFRFAYPALRPALQDLLD